MNLRERILEITVNHRYNHIVGMDEFADKLLAIPIVGKRLEFESAGCEEDDDMVLLCEVSHDLQYLIQPHWNKTTACCTVEGDYDIDIGAFDSVDAAITACTDHAHKLGKQLLGVE